MLTSQILTCRLIHTVIYNSTISSVTVFAVTSAFLQSRRAGHCELRAKHLGANLLIWTYKIRDSRKLLFSLTAEHFHLQDMHLIQLYSINQQPSTDYDGAAQQWCHNLQPRAERSHPRPLMCACTNLPLAPFHDHHKPTLAVYQTRLIRHSHPRWNILAN